MAENENVESGTMLFSVIDTLQSVENLEKIARLSFLWILMKYAVGDVE